MWWPEKISKEDLWRAVDQEPVAAQIHRRKWGWILITLRKPTRKEESNNSDTFSGKEESNSDTVTERKNQTVIM